MNRLMLLFPLLLLSGCGGPAVEAERVAGRTVMVTNKGKDRLSITRIVANDAGGRTECVDEPGTALGSGRSYTTTFMHCEEVSKVAVETNQGTREISFD